MRFEHKALMFGQNKHQKWIPDESLHQYGDFQEIKLELQLLRKLCTKIFGKDLGVTCHISHTAIG